MAAPCRTERIESDHACTVMPQRTRTRSRLSPHRACPSALPVVALVDAAGWSAVRRGWGRRLNGKLRRAGCLKRSPIRRRSRLLRLKHAENAPLRRAERHGCTARGCVAPVEWSAAGGRRQSQPDVAVGLHVVRNSATEGNRRTLRKESVQVKKLQKPGIMTPRPLLIRRSQVRILPGARSVIRGGRATAAAT
jgi:hypothetical protein